MSTDKTQKQSSKFNDDADIEKTGDEQPVRKKDKYRKPKPWDNDPTLDKWAIEEFKPEHNPHGMAEESTFSCLFP